MSATPSSEERQRRNAARAASRMAVVQALYQMEMTGTDAGVVAKEFLDHRLRGGEFEDGLDLSIADPEFFKGVLFGVIEHQDELDLLISKVLSVNWPLSRLDATLRALLRGAAFEFSYRPDVPARVVIDQYLEIAHAFFEGEEPAFANGVLDALTRRLRAAEVLPAEDQPE
jgi:N utilization substance protein B